MSLRSLSIGNRQKQEKHCETTLNVGYFNNLFLYGKRKAKEKYNMNMKINDKDGRFEVLLFVFIKEIS